MKIPFVKMHGAGNDFVMIDDRTGFFPTDDQAFIRRLANRPDGIGCEGVILVQNVSCSQSVPALAPSSSCSQSVPALAPSSSCSQSVPALASQPDFAMRFFNPDGTEADLCGNGARCVAAFARAIGAATVDRMRFATKAGVVAAEILSPTQVRIGMPDPRDFRADFINTGVPHVIVSVDDLASADVANEGRRIRYSERFAPAGTNVDFVRYDDARHAHIRTYERGVEAESFACGTGAVAAACVGVARHGQSFPVALTTARGVELTVDGVFAGGVFSSVTLTGPVAVAFSGEICVPRSNFPR